MITAIPSPPQAGTRRRSGTAPSNASTALIVAIPQYSRAAILAVWVAATVPMGVLAWLVAPAVAERLSGEGQAPMAQALLLCLGAGLVWQFVLVVALVGREQRTLRWSTVRDALWLQAPRSPSAGRSGARMWLILIPLVVVFAASTALPAVVAVPGDRDLSTFLASDAGAAFFAGNWTWVGVMVLLWLFNTVLGEELLFRGFLLPRMNGAFGRSDWAVNGLLFAAYHVHMPWFVLSHLADAFTLAYPSKRYRSAWIGIAVHSSQSVFLAALVLDLAI
jgi:uncharacterized protein